MGRNRIKRVFDKAQQTLASKSEDELLKAYPLRTKDPGRFLRALEDFDGCEFWREAKHHSFLAYFRDSVPGANRLELLGWQTLSCCAHDTKVAELIKLRRVRVRKFCWIKSTVTKANYKMWVFLAMYLNDTELCLAAKGYRQLLRTGVCGEAVFMPMWIPVADYKKYFGDENVETPAWTQVKELFSSGNAELPTVSPVPLRLV